MNRFFLFALLGLSVFPALVSAETLRGEVTSVNQNDGTITVNELSESGKILRANVLMKFGGDPQLFGVQSLNDLKAGDKVQVETHNGSSLGPMEIIRITTGTSGSGTGASAPDSSASYASGQ